MGREKVLSNPLPQSGFGDNVTGSFFSGCLGMSGSRCSNRCPMDIIFPDDFIKIVQTTQHSGRYQQDDGSLAVVTLRIVMVQNIGSIVKMQYCETGITFPQSIDGLVQATEKQQRKSGIHIAFMHPDREHKHGQDDKCTETEISRRLFPATHGYQKSKKHDQKYGNSTPGLARQEEERCILTDPVHTEKPPEIISIYSSIFIGTQSRSIL